ncbi:gastrotropin [Oxyura jamaicensis]|nr:gastrotropin [Oxyura jamaicensis]
MRGKRTGKKENSCLQLCRSVSQGNSRWIQHMICGLKEIRCGLAQESLIACIFHHAYNETNSAMYERKCSGCPKLEEEDEGSGTIIKAILHYQPHHQGNMAFTGKYEFESDENYDDFVKAIGLPSEKVEMGRNCKIVTEVVQNGNDFTWTQHFPGGRTTTNTFTIGKEADMETMGGKKFKATVKMEGGKVVADFPNYHHTAEIAGGKLVELSTASGVTYKRTSKKIA